MQAKCLRSQGIAHNLITNMNESEIMEIIKMTIFLMRTEKNQINPLTGIPSKVIHIKQTQTFHISAMGLRNLANVGPAAGTY